MYNEFHKSSKKNTIFMNFLLRIVKLIKKVSKTIFFHAKQILVTYLSSRDFRILYKMFRLYICFLFFVAVPTLAAESPLGEAQAFFLAISVLAGVITSTTNGSKFDVFSNKRNRKKMPKISIISRYIANLALLIFFLFRGDAFIGFMAFLFQF